MQSNNERIVSKSAVFGANPEDKVSLRCNGRGAGHRRIDKMNLPRRRFGGHLLRERWINRTAIDPKRVLLEDNSEIRLRVKPPVRLRPDAASIVNKMST